MTVHALIDLLLEKEMEDQSGNDFLDRLCLRIFSVPALLTYLSDINQEGDVVELVFMRLPEPGIEAVRKLIGRLPIEVYTFTDSDRNFTAFKVDVSSVADEEKKAAEKASKMKL